MSVQPTPVSRRLPFWVSDARWQQWGIAVSSLLLCGLFVVLHLRQRRDFESQLQSLSRFRQARLDLTQGFLHFSAPHVVGSPFDHNQGLALLRQASAELSRMVSAPGRPRDEASEEFHRQVATFAERLSAGEAGPDSTQDLVALRVSFHHIESMARALDQQSQDRIRQLGDSQDEDFAAGMLSSLAFFVVMWSIVYFSGRSARAAERREKQTAFLLRAVVDGTSDAVFVKDRAGRYLLMNEAASRFAGQAPEAVIGKTDRDLFDSAGAELIRTRDEQVMVSGRTLIEEEHLTVGGRGLVFLANKAPYRNEQGEIAGIIGVSRDITARKESEQQLMRERNRFEQIVAAVPVVICAFRQRADGTFHMPFACPRIEQIYGLKPHEIERDATPIFQVIHPDDVARVQQSIEQACRDQTHWHAEYRVRHPERGELWVEGHSVPAAEPDGGVLWYGYVVDITARKQLEIRVRHQELMIREAAEMAGVGGWSFDPVTLEGDWTAETARIHDFGADEEMRVSQGVGSFAEPDRSKLETALRRAIEEGKPYDLELPMTTHLGRRKWVRAICNPLVDGGRVVRVRGSLQDITDRKLAEDEIRQLNTDLERRVRERTAALEAANQELEAFSYSVSHDLRAPLRALDGFSRILLEDYAGAMPAEAIAVLQDIENSVQGMGRLIDDLLAFARLSRRSLRRELFDMNSLVAESLKEVLPSDGRRREVRIAPLPPCDGDPRLLKQVWNNLLSNAIKYSCRRDPAVIEVGSLAVDSLEGSGPNTAYFVRDNGVGFDMRYASKLFGVFQRLHRSEQYEGTGVGLAIVQRIVHRHGGRVWADAQLDRGATFYFTLGSAPCEHDSAHSPDRAESHCCP